MLLESNYAPFRMHTLSFLKNNTREVMTICTLYYTSLIFYSYITHLIVTKCVYLYQYKTIISHEDTWR